MKKKLLSLFLAVVMICSTLVTMGVTTFADDGTLTPDSIAAAIAAGETVYVEGPKDLKAVMDYGQTNTFEGATVELKANVDASEITWTPIPEFKGTLSGGANKYAIRNLSITGRGFTTKLSGNVENIVFDTCTVKDNLLTGVVTSQVPAGANATITNVTLQNCKVATTNQTADGFFGGLVGILYGNATIDGCHVIGGSIEGGSKNQAMVGGLVGYISNDNNGTKIENSSNSASVQGGMAGGIVGQSRDKDTLINNCRNTGTISADNTGANSKNSFAGGIIGCYFWDGNMIQVSNCTNDGKVTVTVDTTDTTGTGFAGGIVGYANYQFTIQSCANLANGTVTTNGTVAGGIVGCATSASVTTTDCVNYANVKVVTGITTARACCAGGIVGQSKVKDGTLSVSNCANYGEVDTTGGKGTTGAWAGGIVGSAYDWDTSKQYVLNITDCLNEGDVFSAASKKAGGIVGYYCAKTGSFKNCISAGKCDVDNGYGEAALINTVSLKPANTNTFITIQSCYYLPGVSQSGNNDAAITMLADIGGDNGNYKVIYPAADVDFTFLGGTHNVAAEGFSGQGGNKDLYNTVFKSADNPNIPTGTNYKTGALVENEAALSGTVGAAFLSKAGFDFVNTWTLTDGLPVPTKLALGDQKLDDTAEIVYKGCQTKLGDDFGIRLIAGLDSLNFVNTGYEISSLDGGRVLALAPQTTDVVYTSLNTYVNGDNGAELSEPITAEKCGCAYLSAITINDLPTEGTLSLVVKPFVTDGYGNVTYGSTIVISIVNGTVVSRYTC